MNATTTALIYFDGGTTCNKPSVGLGEGYGSYKINSRPIVRLKLGKPHTNNSAEVATLYAAVVEAKALGWRKLHIFGDSQVALKACLPRPVSRSSRYPDNGSDMYKQARRDLQLALAYVTFTTQWVPREQIFNLFGH